MTVVQPPPMSRASPPPLPQRDRVRELGTALAAGVAISGAYVLSGHRLGLPCPFKMLTGWDCPLCGGTRMGAALMHGDLGSAFRYNPLALIGMTVVGLIFVTELAHRIGLVKRDLPTIPRRWRRPLSIAGVAIVVAFTVARNLSVGPLAGWRV